MKKFFFSSGAGLSLSMRSYWGLAALLALPAVVLAQPALQEARTNQEARASDLRAAVRLQQAQAAKQAQQAGIATQKTAQKAEMAKVEGRHLNGDERAQLRKQLATRELRAQQ